MPRSRAEQMQVVNTGFQGLAYKGASAAKPNDTVQAMLGFLDQFTQFQREPMGIQVSDDTYTQIQFTDPTTFQIAPVGASFDIWVQGKRFTYTVPQVVAITDTEGIWYFYFNSAGTLIASQTPWDLSAVAPIATVYYDAVNNVHLAFADERHGVVMDWATHQLLHTTVGTRFQTGLAVTGITNGNGTLDTHAQIAVSSGTIWDEDIPATIQDGTTARFQQPLNLPANLPIFYLSGTGIWRRKTPDNFPVYKGVTRPFFNQFSSPNWLLTEVAANNFVAMWIFGSTDYEWPVFAIMGQREDTSLANAQNNNTFASLSLPLLILAEFKLLFRVIFQCGPNAGYGNAVNARTREIQDLRNILNLPSGTFVATDHNSLAGRDVFPAHPGSAINFSARTQTLYVAKFGSDTNTGTDPEHPFLTIQAAITAAGAPASEDAAFSVVVLDDGLYVENLTMVNHVHLYAPYATIQGTVTFSTASQVNHVVVRRLTNNGNTDIILVTNTGDIFVQADTIDSTATAAFGCVTNTSTGNVRVDAKKITATNGKGLYVSAGGFINARINTLVSTAGDAYNVSATGAIRLTVNRIDGTVTVAAGGQVWFEIIRIDEASSDAESTSTADTYQNKLTLTTASLPKGRYRVFYSAEAGNQTGNRSTNVRCTVAATTVAEVIISSPTAADYLPFAGFFDYDLAAAGTITATIDYFRTNTAGTAQIRRARLAIVRVR